MKTVTSVLQKCKSLRHLKEFHAHLVRLHPLDNPVGVGPLLSFAAASKNAAFFSYARSIFRHVRKPNTFMYNAMIRGYMQSDSPTSSVVCYMDMLGCGIAGNNYTFPPLIKACIFLNLGSGLSLLGRLVHAHVVKFGFWDDPFVISALMELYCSVDDTAAARKLFHGSIRKDVVMWTILIDGYAKAGDVVSARELFEEMPVRNVISWSAMIAAYSRVGDFKEVLNLFSQMQQLWIEPNESVLVSVLTACSHLGAVSHGLWVHSYAKRLKFETNPILATALIDMYSKCGFLDLAQAVFYGMPVNDAGAWNAMIHGAALNGDGWKSLELFHKMVTSGIQPTETTFIVVLTACTHAGLVNEGLALYEEMSTLYEMEPRLEHSACVVDLLARSGLVGEAEEFVEKNMGGIEGGDANVWGALLRACRVYGNVELGNRIWRSLSDMGVNDYGNHVVSYNMFQEAGWENEANRTRTLISNSGMTKKPGCSMIELDGVVKEFVAADFGHSKAGDIYRLLESISRVVKSEESHIG